MDRHARASGSQGYVQHYFHGRATDFYSWSILLQSRKSTGSGIRSPCESVFALKEMALTGRAGKGQGQTPPRRRSSRSSLAAYRARIWSPCRQILSRAKCSNGRTAGQWPWHPFPGECQASAAPGCAAEKGYRHRRPRRQPDFSPRPHSRRGEIPVHWEPCWQ